MHMSHEEDDEKCFQKTFLKKIIQRCAFGLRLKEMFLGYSILNFSFVKFVKMIKNSKLSA